VFFYCFRYVPLFPDVKSTVISASTQCTHTGHYWRLALHGLKLNQIVSRKKNFSSYLAENRQSLLLRLTGECCQRNNPCFIMRIIRYIAYRSVWGGFRVSGCETLWCVRIITTERNSLKTEIHVNCM